MIPIATIEAYVSQVVGTNVTISCEADATFHVGWDGFVLRGADGSILHVEHVRQSLCDAAENADHKQNPNPSWYVLSGGQRADTTTGTALAVIEHEALHIALQSSDEGVVECTMYQNRWPFVRLFGLPAWVARIVQNGMAWNHFQMPAAYRTVC